MEKWLESFLTEHPICRRDMEEREASTRLFSDHKYTRHVITEGNKLMKISFNPNTDYAPAGTVSFVSWQDRNLQDAIRKAFRESPREEIVELVVESNGIKAVFEPRNC